MKTTAVLTIGSAFDNDFEDHPYDGYSLVTTSSREGHVVATFRGMYEGKVTTSLGTILTSTDARRLAAMLTAAAEDADR